MAKSLFANPALTSLSIAPRTKKPTVDELLGFLPAETSSALVTLNISQTDATDEGFRAVSKACPRLTSLVIGDCLHLSSVSIEAVVRSCRNLEHLDISGCFGMWSRSLMNSCLAEIYVHLRKLRSLVLARSEGLNNLCFTLSAVISVAHLDLSMCSNVTDAGIFQAMVRPNPAVRSLNLSRCADIGRVGVMNLGSVFPKLESLDLSHCGALAMPGGLSPNAMDTAALRMPHLTRLSLQGHKMLSDECIEVLSAHCKKLTELNLTSCKRLTDNALGWLRQLPALASLNLSYCWGITNTGLSRLGTIRSLTHVSIVGWKMKHITDPGLHALSSSGNLRSVDVSACPFITSKGVKMLASQSRRLEWIAFVSCPLISDEAIVSLVQHCPELSVVQAQQCDMLTDASLNELHKAKKLKQLHVLGCPLLTPAACERFRASHPNVLKL